MNSPIDKLLVKKGSSQLFELRQFIYGVVHGLYPQIADFTMSEISLEHPSQETFGDYSTNVAMVLAGRLRMNPKKIAEEIAIKLKEKSSDTIIDRVEAAGGFINIWLSQEFLNSVFKGAINGAFHTQLTSEIEKLIGSSVCGKKIFVEFAHPNTHKEFHIGHLRNIAIGEAFVRILEACGATVFRANYEGDVGLHVAKAIYGVKVKIENEKLKIEDLRQLEPDKKAKFLGEGYALGSKLSDESEETKKEIIELNKTIYVDPKKADLWEETRQWSLDYFETIYRRLGTRKFDRYFFESETEKDGREMVIAAAKKGIFIQDKDGSIYFPGSKYGLNDCVFVTREHYATYEGKEIALEELELNTFPFDLSINNVANEQANFFQVSYKATEVLFPRHIGKHYHTAYGMVNLKGVKLSSRTGQVVTADWLIDQAKEKVKVIIEKASERNSLNSEEIESVAEKVAVAAVKYSMLKVNPKMDIAFDLEESVSFEGDSGPYLQYTYARCKSVLRKGERVKGEGGGGGWRKENMNEDEMILLRSFYRFPEVVLDAGRTLSPNILCSYLFELAQKFNFFYNKHSILTPELPNEDSSIGKEEVTTFRLGLTVATANILQKGLELLGIETVERM